MRVVLDNDSLTRSDVGITHLARQGFDETVIRQLWTPHLARNVDPVDVVVLYRRESAGTGSSGG